MKVIDKESIVMCDVDDTLVIWGKVTKGRKAVKVINPYNGEEEVLGVHKGHIKILKDRKARGSFIVVWSAGGFAWAQAVIKALDLEASVDLIMTKPHIYIDDKKAEEFMGEHVYLGKDSTYGT